MLGDLVAYYEQLAREQSSHMPLIGWSSTRVSYVAQISEDGMLLALVPLADRSAMERIVPERVKRSVNIAANFLCDNSSYILGLDQKGNRNRTEQCYAAARDLHRELLVGVESPCARAIVRYFENDRPEEHSSVVFNVNDNVFAGGNIIFYVKVGGILLDPLQDEAIKGAWMHRLNSVRTESPMRCLVTGEVAPIARLHPPIKGVYGAQSSGASLVSFNARAFESYGHEGEQGRNAPVSEYAAKAYAMALNYLLADPRHHMRLGDMTVVYWSERGDAENSQTFSFAMGGALFIDADAKDDADDVVDATMKAIACGAYRDLDGVDLDATFHVLGLSPSAARLVVKFHYKDSFGKMLKNLATHYRRSDIVHGPNERAYLTPYQLLKDVEHPKAKKPVVVPILNGPLLKSMLEDTAYPRALYTNALLRVRATQEDSDNHVRKVTRARASIIRSYLIKNCKRQGYDEEGLTVGLNEERNETAYCLGRAFAILEQIQEEANGKATITNRYFNAAGTTPLTVFPSMIRLSDAHLTKIGRKRSGFAIYLKQQLHSVLGEERVPHFPKRLSLEEQGDFILGYVHQRNERYKAKATSELASTINEEN